MKVKWTFGFPFKAQLPWKDEAQIDGEKIPSKILNTNTWEIESFCQKM